MSMKIFGICAEKQSGKDSFADFALEALPAKWGTKRALATPLKRFCVDYLGLSEQSVFGNDSDKNTPIGIWNEIFSPAIAGKYDKHGETISGREVLQVVGTDIFRKNFCPTFWIDIMLKKTIPTCAAQGVEIIFVTDVRFRNEVEGLQAAGAKVIRLYRDIPRDNQIQHESETEMASISDNLFNYVVTPDQNTSMGMLRNSVHRILQKEGLL